MYPKYNMNVQLFHTVHCAEIDQLLSLFIAKEVGYGPKENKLEAKSVRKEAVSRLMKQKQDMGAPVRALTEGMKDLVSKVIQQMHSQRIFRLV